MEYEQKLKDKSYVPLDKKTTPMHFDIRFDAGNLYTPGKMVCSSQHIAMYCQSNSGTEFVLDGEHYQLQRGDIVLIKSNVPHGFLSYSKNEDPYAGYIVSVNEEYLNHLKMRLDMEIMEFVQKSKVIRTRGTLWERIDVLFLMALEESELKAPGWETALFGNSIILMIHIARAAASDPNTTMQMEKPELLTSILAYVENNLHEKITLEDVASRFFVSSSTITHLFNKKMNISFYKFVMQRRLWRAKNLIKEGMPMEKIANQVGFGDYSAFYRAFKQEFGQSPRQFYKESREESL